jgi:hypothetical protein
MYMMFNWYSRDSKAGNKINIEIQGKRVYDLNLFSTANISVQNKKKNKFLSLESDAYH